MDPVFKGRVGEGVAVEDHLRVDAEVHQDWGDVAQLELPAVVRVVAQKVQQSLVRDQP